MTDNTHKLAADALQKIFDFTTGYDDVAGIVNKIAREALAALDAAPAHTDHPLRHWDRTCPACIAEVAPERDVAERVKEACEKVCDYMASGNIGSERLMAERCANAIHNLDLSQFTERAGGQGNKPLAQVAGCVDAGNGSQLSPVPSALPAGMVMVPREPTGEMWSAGRKEFVERADKHCACKRHEEASAYADRSPVIIYQAMLAAAPQPADAPEEE